PLTAPRSCGRQARSEPEETPGPVGQVDNLRADWQSAQACAGSQPACRMPSCRMWQTDLGDAPCIPAPHVGIRNGECPPRDALFRTRKIDCSGLPSATNIRWVSYPKDFALRIRSTCLGLESVVS